MLIAGPLSVQMPSTGVGTGIGFALAQSERHPSLASVRSWIFRRDPRFEEKAGPVLDLYQGLRHGGATARRRHSSATANGAARPLHDARPPIPGRHRPGAGRERSVPPLHSMSLHDQ